MLPFIDNPWGFSTALYLTIKNNGVRDDLQHDLCLGCGEISPSGRGLFAAIEHVCPLNTYTYRISVGISFLKMWNDLISLSEGGKGSMKSFNDLLDFPYLKAMPDFYTATDSEKRIYGFIRDAEVKAMKRLRALIELEEAFNIKY